jgi:hypothetical protein
VLAEQRLDPLGVLAYDLLLVLVSAREIEARLAATDPELGGAARFLEQVGGVEQRFGRDAAAMQAGAAPEDCDPSRPAVTARPSWRGPDGRDVAAGAAADDGRGRERRAWSS